jgi:hypothetical protein
MGQIVTMIYAAFGMPIFMLWASNMGTLMAQLFKVLYSYSWRCVRWRGRRGRGGEERVPRREERAPRREPEVPGRGSPPAPVPVTVSSPPEEPAASPPPGQPGEAGGLQELLAACALYNLAEVGEHAPSAALLEELQAEERSRQASSLSLPQLTPVSRPRSPHSRGEPGLAGPGPGRRSPGSLLAPPGPGSREPSPAPSGRSRGRGGGPAIQRVPPLPVICFLLLYLTLGALIFSKWEGWSVPEGFYFCFITLTTIGLGDFVPGDAVMSLDSTDGQYKLICSVVYLLLGLAVLSMCFNLIQEEAVEFFIKKAKNCGIIDDDDEEETI